MRLGVFIAPSREEMPPGYNHGPAVFFKKLELKPILLKGHYEHTNKNTRKGGTWRSTSGSSRMGMAETTTLQQAQDTEHYSKTTRTADTLVQNQKAST